eukprot:12133132-Alexandrium_andersonii.AAC.1
MGVDRDAGGLWPKGALAPGSRGAQSDRQIYDQREVVGLDISPGKGIKVPDYALPPGRGQAEVQLGVVGGRNR